MDPLEKDHAPYPGLAEPSLRAKRHTKEYFEAILRCGPALVDVAAVKVLLESDDPDERDRAAEYFPKLWKAYRDEAAEIQSFYFGQYAPWGIVLFWDGHFDWGYRIEFASLVTANWERQLQACAASISEAQDILSGIDTITIQEQLVALINMLFTSLDIVAFNPGSQVAKDRLNESVKFVEQRQKEISANIRDLGLKKDRRTAQQLYLFGMLPGLALIAAVLVPVAVYTKIGLATVTTVGAGSLGAILSVLARTTKAQVRNSLDIDHQVGNRLIFLAGLFRPIVGALLAAALYVLINAGIIPLKIPAPPENNYFFTGVAFLAGFSERLAQDALVRTSRATFLLKNNYA